MRLFLSQVSRGAILVSLAVAACRSAGGTAAGPPTLESPPQASVDAAIEAPLTRHHRDLPGGAHTNMGHRDEAPVILAAASFADNRSADRRLLEQMRYTLVGGNDITANGGYPAQVNQYVLIAGGYWQRDRLARESLARIRVGVQDLWYKLDHGYSNYAKGRKQGDLSSRSTAYGFEFTRPLWEEVVLPYHR